jgi:hypothetical protein
LIEFKKASARVANGTVPWSRNLLAVQFKHSSPTKLLNLIRAKDVLEVKNAVKLALGRTHMP